MKTVRKEATACWWGKETIKVVFYNKHKKESLSVLSIKESDDVLSLVKDAEHALCESEALRYVKTPAEPILLVEVGKEKGLDSIDHLRMAAYRLYNWAESHSVSKLLVLPLKDDSAQKRTALLHGLNHASYRFEKYKSDAKNRIKIEVDFLDNIKIDDKGITALFNGIELAKNLINEPGGSLIPTDIAHQASTIARKFGLKIKVRGEKELKHEKFEGLLTVGRGSENPPALVTLTYKPQHAKTKNHLALVGKGISFDTGGICIKPQDKMWEMKSDMSGAATVLGAIQTIAALKLPVCVTAVLCLAENRPGANAVLPGDIFKAKNGKTVMVENTDAEGRLVLTDGLWEAAALGATHIVDIATLTGACQRALGNSIGGMFSNDSGLAKDILVSGAENGEKWWRLPLDEEYAEGLKDKVADLKNITGGVGPGAITAALFLQHFVKKDVAWAHLDIAGTAFTSGEYKYTANGATAFGLKTLVELSKRLSVQTK